MKRIRIKTEKLDYINPQDALLRFQDQHNLIFLDSANNTISKNNRYSYIAFDPIDSIKINKKNINFSSKEFIKARNILSKVNFKKIRSLPHFQCGYAGYVSYESGLINEKIRNNKKNEKIVPNIYLGLFDIVFAFDNKFKKAFLFSCDLNNEIKNKANHKVRLQKAKNLYSIPRLNNAKVKLKGFNWKKDFTKKKYILKIKKVLEYIKDGDIFQANITQRFLSKIPNDFKSAQYYLKYRENTETPFSCLIKNSNFTILSYSPERFLRLEGNKIKVSPIKGTIKRGQSELEDRKLVASLKASEKDNAENLMIVDVLRNDISQACKPGSVKVTRLAEVETYNNVHHLVSDIEGSIKKGSDIFDILNFCMPGGSVTGAPKIRAMHIISELEDSNRGVYCGAIGYASFSGYSDFNIPIRTITVNKKRAYLNSGGGIVSDSDPLNEFLELNEKVENLVNINKTARNNASHEVERVE